MVISKASEITNISAFVSGCATLAAIGLLLWISFEDLRHQRINNRAVLALLLLYVPLQGSFGFPQLASDFLAGGTLFGIGFILWLARALGAGDAKLMLPLGLLMGIDGLPLFGILLITCTCAFVMASTISLYLKTENSVVLWFSRCRETGKTPYGPLLSAAAIPALIGSLFSNT